MKGFLTAVLLMSPLTVSAQKVGDDIKSPVVSGYFNFQYALDHGALNSSASPIPGPGSGFVLHQGAVMVSQETNGVEFLVDIPFRRGVFISRGGAADLNASATNELELATEEAQAFVKWMGVSGFGIQAGQFDSPFGLEANDTKDIFFARHGILRDMRPRTHTGLMIDYTRLPWAIQFLVSNSGEAGRQPSDRSPSVGLRGLWAQGPASLSLGALYEDVRGRRPRIMLNAVGEFEWWDFRFGAEVNITQSEIEQSALGPKHEIVSGFLIQAVRPVWEKWSAGFRYEYTRNDERSLYMRYLQAYNASVTLSGQGSHLSKMTFGARYDWNEDIQLRGDMNFQSFNPGVDDLIGRQVSFTTGMLGVVYSF